MNIEQTFHDEMMQGIAETTKRFGYVPTYFLQMVTQHGAIQTAKILLAAETPQEGLNKLWELGQLHMTMEAQVLDPKYRLLFTRQERAVALKRLVERGYDPTTR